jgi:parallel beta-helix repeat protein
MSNKITSYGIVYMLVIAAFFGFITFGPGIVNAVGMTFYVDDDNLAGPWDGSMANPYQTINDAIAASTDGDTIYVFNGTYVENVWVDKSLTIIGNGTGNTTIEAPGGGDVVMVIADMVNITGFTCMSGSNGIHLFTASNCTISNNNVTNNPYGIVIESSVNNDIIDNEVFSNWQRGIYVFQSSDNTITNNNVSNAGTGILVESSSNNNISANNFSNGNWGIFIEYSSDCTILGNDFTDGGVYIWGGPLSEYNSHTITPDNLVGGDPVYYHKDTSGLFIDGIPVGQLILANCTDMDVKNLQINDMGAGIQMAYTYNTNLTGNTVTDCYYGIHITYSSYNNISSNEVTGCNYNTFLYWATYNMFTGNNLSTGVNGYHLDGSGNNDIIGNNITDFDTAGISISNSYENNVTGNDVFLNNGRGIYISGSYSNNIKANTISSNGNMGIEVYSSETNTITGNTFTNDGLFFWGGIMAHFNSHTVPTSNMVNGKPMYYYKDTNNLIIDGTTMGQLILANCNDADVKNLEINDTDVGIQIAYCLNASVSENHIYDNKYGLYYSYSDYGTMSKNDVETHDSTGINMFFSENNLISENNVTSNSGFGIYLSFSHFNNVRGNNASGNIEGIDIYQSDGNTVANNTAINNIEYGIYVNNNCEDNTIINNTAEENDIGIYIASGGTKYIVVSHNTIRDCTSSGIFLNTVWQNTISSNNISNCLYGIGYANSDANTIINNTLTFNTVGINVNSFSTDNTISYNTISNNTGTGIYVSSSSDKNVITYNDINNNTVYGIRITSSDNNTIHHNNIAYNRGSNDTYNPSNIQAMDDSTNFWNASSKGNWWADWTIPDIIAPFGIVDNPYVLDGGIEQDNFPLVNPVDPVPPTISNLQPSNGATLMVNTTTIAANYTDAAGINESSVMLDVDGVAVTIFSTVGPDGIFYDPGTPFADGTHTINLSVADIHDNIAIASWSFTVDTMWPVIMNKKPSPSSITSDNLTTISADYSDAEGIDIGGVMLKVDNNDETSNATVTASNITFTPMTPLTEGLHTVELIVTDLSGWSTGQIWTFTVDAIPPVIFNMLPLNGTTLAVNITTISANYTDSDGINVNSVVLKINGGNETSSATVTSDGVSFTPVVGLVDGTHSVYLEVMNIYDNPANATWYFTIDTTAPDITNLKPADATTTSDNAATISANFTDPSGIDMGSIVLKVDGVDETLSATVTADGISFSPAVPWTDDTHTIELSVNDTYSNAATLIWSFEVDTTPPEVINDLTPSDPTIDSIILTWTAPGDDGGSGIATEYVVKYSTTGAITESNWNSATTYSQSWTPLAAGETETYTISGLDPDTQYWFAIRALDEISNVADPSNSPEATTLVIKTAPTAPESFELAWGDSYVHLTWDAPSDDGNSPVTNYVIYRGTSSGSITFLDEIGDVLEYNDTTATNGIRYYYKVSAKNTVGEGPQTAQESATPATTPSAPQNLQASAGIGYVEITWEAPSDDGGSSISNYRVYRANASGAEIFLIQLSKVLLYNDTDVKEGVTYYYIVRAKNSLGDGVESSEVFGTPTAPPNILPISGITSLAPGQVLEGTVTISGIASDPEDSLERVEIRIDGGQWIEVTGTDTWSHDLDTTALSNGDHTISIRSYDGEDYSAEDTVTVEVNNPKPKEDKTLFEETWFFPLIIVVIIIIVLVLLMAMRKKAPGEGMPDEEDIPPEGSPEEEAEEEAGEEPDEDVEEEPVEEETPAEEPVEEEALVDEPGEEASDINAEEELVEEDISEETPFTGEAREETEGRGPEANKGEEDTEDM